MHKLLTLLVVALTAGAAATVALADHKPGHPAKGAKGQGKAQVKAAKPAKIAICHRTMAAENAHHTIRVSERAWPAHERHGDAKTACDGDGAAEPAGTSALGTTLAAVTGATGSGTFHVDVRRLKNDRARVCYTLSVTGVDATAAHIHTSVAQDYATAPDVAANGIVASLKTPTGGLARGCANVPREVAVDVATNPAEYYVDVHSAAFQAGQIQGTLALDS